MTHRLFLATLVMACSALCSSPIYGQLSLKGELLTRAQVRNGARQLPIPDDEPAWFLSQRTRLTTEYQYKQVFKTYFSFQDVRVWGQLDQENVGATLNVYKAWGELYFGKRWALRVGRQGLHYDDGFLFADPNWREAGRTHDAVRLFYNDSLLSIHLGGAYNANGASNSLQPYLLNTYQNMQWAWAKTPLGPHTNISVMGVRTAKQRPDASYYTNYTVGGEFGYDDERWSAKGVGYYQFGNNSANIPINAYFFHGRVGYTDNQWHWQAAYFSVSGNEATPIISPQSDRRFDILYGFRHRYFGTMDYFYSTTFNPRTGLNNLRIRSEWHPIEALSMRADVHAFQAANQVSTRPIDQSIPNYLGTELDLSVVYQWKPMVEFRGGYSHLWGTGSLEQLAGGSADRIANWFWLQVYFTPTFLHKETFIQGPAR